MTQDSQLKTQNSRLKTQKYLSDQQCLQFQYKDDIYFSMFSAGFLWGAWFLFMWK